ncbi:hypothetical protein F2Q68_00038703 [Brassica cretica]|uniref:Uncharacterized protein n=2 Tax=Brassica cretica TaxID=69181 RepID=A0A8S9MH01_BRACR|nr:hypothetical protein F2Q68_00038703 [Brassica cretica]KAF3495930.1 hypothetical protein DY000_02052260 [Brassica cretica]
MTLKSSSNHNTIATAPNQASSARPCFTTGVSVLFFFVLVVMIRRLEAPESSCS